LSVDQPDRPRPRPRGLAFVLVRPPSLGSAGLESIPGDVTLARFLDPFLARFVASLGIDV
jgi:hypothetical protein